MTDAAKKVKASERLSSMEKILLPMQKRVGEMELMVFNLSRENDVLKDALQLMHEKQESIVALITEGKQLTDENINEKVVMLKEQSLKDKVTDLVNNGKIDPTEKISKKSLIVARELNKDGTVENPRIQFLVGRLVEELQDKFLGKGIGDLVEGEENKLDIEIMEIYDVLEQKMGSQEPMQEQEELLKEVDPVEKDESE